MIVGSKRMPAVLAVLGAGVVICCSLTNSKASEAMIASAADDSGQRIETLIHEWFSLLREPALDSTTLAGLLAEPRFKLTTADQTLRSLSELRSWISNLRTTDPDIRYQIGSIRIDPVGKDLYRARFEFDRRMLDDAGLPHVARREHTWTIRADSDAAPVVLEIEERSLLPFPGTGPEIVCY